MSFATEMPVSGTQIFVQLGVPAFEIDKWTKFYSIFGFQAGFQVPFLPSNSFLYEMHVGISCKLTNVSFVAAHKTDTELF